MRKPAVLTEMPGHLIRRLNQHSTAVFQQHLKAAGHDITSVQFSALKALADHADLDQASLAALIEYDRATIGGVVKRLEQKSLVQRTKNETDRRAIKLALTPAGRLLLSQVEPLVAGLQNDILGHLTPDEARALTLLLQKALQLDHDCITRTQTSQESQT
ncbi:MarR family transcriptional regulator [uncultured Sulfitobacter sp.]|uniref:MarR family winged helix-turn-helix transcriptional regulator n=1 Tax=uncultured Sulfitobacter sp. TaxID=191468 RepID=UPI002631BE83|nr:MarR family transcriptional regulator [uncultured Sulfitobacter sp.]